MNNRANQIYEEYWSYTAAWTNIHGKKFIDCLRVCVDFFNDNHILSYDSMLYEKLQEKVIKEIGFHGPDAGLSARKGINQMVKIGFLKPYLAGYRPEAIEYLNAKTNRRRQNIISKVVYNYSNFQNSITDPEAETANQMRFLLRTLEEVGSLDKRGLISLMTTDINDYTKGYLTKEELDYLYSNACDIDFIDRKYNQLSHFLNLLGKLDDLCDRDGVIYFKTDADILFGAEVEKKKVRDPYLQRIYKSELEEESCIHYECKNPRCMLEGICYPVLIASHIKPYSHCNNGDKEQFDVNNGLLLSKNIDSLFDLGYITINHDGNIIASNQLDISVKQFISQFRLHEDFINPKRMDYMAYHRAHVFDKRYSTHNVKRYIMLDDNSVRIAAEP